MNDEVAFPEVQNLCHKSGLRHCLKQYDRAFEMRDASVLVLESLKTVPEAGIRVAFGVRAVALFFHEPPAIRKNVQSLSDGTDAHAEVCRQLRFARNRFVERPSAIAFSIDWATCA